MHIGVCMFNTDYAIRIEELARAAEERRFESLFVPEHTHIPASRRTPFPSGGELPREYSHTLDPFVALAHAAAVTTRIRLGTGICLIIERDTITTAKEVASVDFVSNGRFLFGIGGGWNVEEMEHHGTDPKTRFKRLGEQVLAMKQIWTKEAAEFHGKICFMASTCSPSRLRSEEHTSELQSLAYLVCRLLLLKKKKQKKNVR